MSLSPELCLRGVLDTLQNCIAPNLPDSYSGEVARLAGLVLAITANGIDDAAAIRISENEAMRRLFADAAASVADAGLASRLGTAAQARNAGFKLSVLDRDNAALRSLLLELHSAVEGESVNEARAIDSQIWRMLQQFEEARAPRR